eukprot:COSAG05_NODE_923_length_6573_cov_168.011725_12_plen_97_part_00
MCDCVCVLGAVFAAGVAQAVADPLLLGPAPPPPSYFGVFLPAELVRSTAVSALSEAVLPAPPQATGTVFSLLSLPAAIYVEYKSSERCLFAMNGLK